MKVKTVHYNYSTEGAELAFHGHDGSVQRVTLTPDLVSPLVLEFQRFLLQRFQDERVNTAYQDDPGQHLLIEVEAVAPASNGEEVGLLAETQQLGQVVLMLSSLAASQLGDVDLSSLLKPPKKAN